MKLVKTFFKTLLNSFGLLFIYTLWCKLTAYVPHPNEWFVVWLMTMFVGRIIEIECQG